MKKLSFLKCFVETLPSASESLVKTLRATSLLGMMVLAPMGATAQVTIGSNDLPQATLDVVASKTDGSTAEGIIAPRLTLVQLKAADAQYLAAQTGTVVYVTDATGTTTAKTANVTAAGYYYFDGTVWQKMGGMVAADMPDVITADNGLTENPNNNIQLGGTLTKNTTIDQGSFSLTHSGTGKTVISTPLQYNNSGASAGAGKVLTSDADGNATWGAPPAVESVIGTMGAGIDISSDDTSSTPWLYTGSYITLPPGIWAVNVHMVLRSSARTAFNETWWVRSTFSDTTTSPASSPDIIQGARQASGLFPSLSRYTMLSGIILINNTSGADKTYYYCGGHVDSYNATVSLFFGSGTLTENSIIAERITIRQ